MILAFAASADLSEPSLWTIVIVLASIVAWGGRVVFRRLNDCEDDREVLHQRVNHIEVLYAITTGTPVQFDSDEMRRKRKKP
jgi:hypothetical protein